MEYSSASPVNECPHSWRATLTDAAFVEMTGTAPPAPPYVWSFTMTRIASQSGYAAAAAWTSAESTYMSRWMLSRQNDASNAVETNVPRSGSFSISASPQHVGGSAAAHAASYVGWSAPDCAEDVKRETTFTKFPYSA